MMVLVQVALDFVDLERALKAAEEAVAGGADWLEAGTPLIKSEGMAAVRELKRRFPNKTIVADMKTMDTGALEAEIACKSGADVVSILAAADDKTIKEAAVACKRYGAKLMVDLINCHKPVERGIACEKLGAEIICAHAGIDQQMEGLSSIGIAKGLSGKVKARIAVGGGMNSENAVEAAKYGEIIVVGGAITKAGDAAAATRVIKDALKRGKPIKSELYKKYGAADLAKVFTKVSTPNISNAMQHRGEIRGVRNLFGMKFAGPALTVLTYDGDWAKPVEALERAEPGTVLVIDAQGGEKAVWGELASNSAIVRKLAAIVIDGAARDVDEIRPLKLPLCARNVSSASGDPKGWGEIGPEILCGGVKVRTGDWVIGDENGIVVVPQEEAVEMANRSLDVMERENRLRAEIRRGKTLSEVAYLKKWEKVG